MGDEGQENFGLGWSRENVPGGSLDAGVIHAQHFASSMPQDTTNLTPIFEYAETSIGAFRQEMQLSKQLGSNRGGFGSQQQQQQANFFGTVAAGELLDPLHGLPVHLSAQPIRRNALAYSETSASRRSSLGLRPQQQQAWDVSSCMGTVSEGYDNIEERINAGITAALKAAARRISAKASAASRHAASLQGVGSPLQQARPGELAPAAAPEALSAQCQEGATADAVAAAMQEWAAAMLETQLGQQLRQQVQQLEQDVEGLKDSVATHLGSSKAQETQVQQLKEWQAQVQQGLAQKQQRLTQEAGTWQKQLVQQQELVAALTAEVQELRQQQQRASTPVMQELLSELRVEAQLQTAQLGKQQEERVSLMLGDIREELLDRLDGLQLRLQSVEEEQERIGERQQQQSKELAAAAAAAASGAAAPGRQASCGRQRVCAGPAVAAAAPSQSESGVMGALPPGFALPDMASMIPTSISEPEAQHSRYSSIHAGPSSILEQHTPRQQPSAGAAGEALPAGYERSGLELSAMLSESQDCRNQLLSDVADLVERVRVLEQQQGQAEGVSSRLEALEDQLGDAAPLDGMTCGAVEARLSVLEDDSNEAKQQLQAAHQQLANMLAQLEPLQQHHASDRSGTQNALPEQQQQERGSAAADADLAARIATLEAQQQELRELAQRLEAAQQQLATGDGSSVSLDSQQSSVRDRIQLFEEQLNAAIRRFASGQLGSRPASDGGAPGAASDPGGKNPGREASLRELLANLQADVEQLQCTAAAGDSSDASCCTSSSSGSAGVPEDAGCVQAGQLQQQLAKLTQNCAELGEAVLQLDLQMQQVEDRLKQQRQQSLTATQSATAATYISKEAAHEIERVHVQVQQLAAAVNGLGSSKDATGAGDSTTAEDGTSCPAGTADTDVQQAQGSRGSALAEKLQQLEESVVLLTQQVQDGAQQLREHAEAQERHAAAARQLEQHLADHQQQAAAAAGAQQQQLDVLSAAQREYKQQHQRSDAVEQLAQVSKQYEDQQAALEVLRKQGQEQHDALLTQLQEGSKGLLDLRQQLEAQIGSCAPAATLQQLQEQLDQLQQKLEQLSEASADARQQLEQHASSSAFETRLSTLEGGSDLADLQAQLSKVQEQLSQQATQADEQSGLLFGVRVDLQNGLQELGKRLAGVESLREDFSICEDSRKAAAERTEAAAAEALEKVEAMMASFAERQAQQMQQAQLAAESSSASVHAELEVLQQQLQSLKDELAGLQQSIAAAQQELSAEWQGAHAAAAEQHQAVQQRLDQCCQQLQDLQEQQQQMQPQAEQLREQLEQKLGTVEADLRTQLLSHNNELQQHASTSQQLRDQAVQAEVALAELRAKLDSQQAGWEAHLPAVQEQVAQLRAQVQQQGEVPAQLEQVRQQLQELQDSSAAQAGSQQACSAQISSLEQLLQEVQQQAEGSAAKLQEAQADDQHLQEQLGVLKAEQAEQLVKGLQPLQEEQAALDKRVQDQEAAAAAYQQQLSQWEQQLQELLARVAEVRAQQAQQQETLPGAEQQAQQLQQLQAELANLLQQQQDSAAMAEELRQLDQERARDSHLTLNDQLQQQAGQFADVQQQLAELLGATKRLQEQVQQQQPDLACIEQLQQQVQDLSAQLQRLDKAVHDQQQATSSSAALQARQLQQHQERLDSLPQQLQDLQQCQGQHTSQLQDLTTHRDDQQSQLQAVQAHMQQVSDKLGGLTQQQSQQQDVVSDLRQQQDQGVQLLQQLEVRVDAFDPSVKQAAADAAAAVSSAAAAEEQVRELREDLEEALGFMAPFLSSPAASSLTSPGGTPFVSPHPQRALAAAAGLPPDGLPANSSFGPQSPLCAPTYSINPLGAAMPGGYSVTIDIGAQLPPRPLAALPGQQQQQLALQSSSLYALHQQQQQLGLLEAPGSSAAASRRVSLQDSAVSVAAAYLPLSAGLWRPEPHQVAATSGSEQAAEAQPAGAAAAAGGPAAAGLSRCEAQVTPGSSANRLARSASLDSPSFTAAAMAGVGYDPTPPSQPSSGSRPFRGQLAGSGGARQDAAVGAAVPTGGSSAGRLRRTLSLDLPSFVAAATAGLAYDLTPGRSASGAPQQAEAGGAGRSALSVDASGAALRLFDALGDAADSPAAGDDSRHAAPSLLAGPQEDDSPEHHSTQQHKLPGGVVASALLRSGSNLQLVSHSTAEGIGSQRSSAVWSCRDSAVFDNGLYNTPKKRRKSRAADAGSTLGGAASVGAPCSSDDGGGSDAASDSGSSSHGGLVSLTDSLTALQLQRLQQQQQAGAVQGAGVAATAGSPPVTPTGTMGGVFDGSSPATTATPVSVYRNAVYEAGATGQVPQQQLPAAAFASGGAQLSASRALQLESHPAAPASAANPVATAAAFSSSSSSFVTPGPAAPQAPALATESSAEDAAAAAMSAGRSLSPAEAVATVRSLAASATTPPSLSSWQKKRQQQQRQQQHDEQGLSGTPEHATEQQEQRQQQDGACEAAPSSCDLAAGPAAAEGDSPAMLPPVSSRPQQQQTQGWGVGCSITFDAEGGCEAAAGLQQEQPAAALSAELLQQHTRQQQQEHGRDRQLPWLQQQQVQASPGVRAGPLPSPAAWSDPAATPWEQQQQVPLSGQGTSEAVLSPMMSELMSLGADVIDLEGSEAESDLLAATPDRSCSKTAPAAVGAGAFDGVSKQLMFGEPAAGDADAVNVQQQQQALAGTCTNSAPASVQAAEPGAAASTSSTIEVEQEQEQEPVLRLKGGGGYEPHAAADLEGEGAAAWQLSREDSFDLADYDSSDGEGGSSSDSYWEAWELVQAPGRCSTAAAAAGWGAAAGQGATTPAGQPPPAASAVAAGPGGSSSCSAAQPAARRAPAPVPQGWLRALPPDWQVGAAPADAYRVALRTSSKAGSGTKTRATVLLTGMTGSICCEHKLGGGRKRCSYPPSSTVQDWLFLQHTPARSSSSDAAPAGQRHAPGVSAVAVSHDAAGFSGAWLLECVIVQHLSSGEWWQFDNRAGWIKGTQQAKAVVAERGAAGQEGEGAAQEGASSAAAKPLPQQLQLSASGVADNCPLEGMPRSSRSSSSGGHMAQGQQASNPPQPQQQMQPSAAAGDASRGSTSVLGTAADTAAAYGGGDDASTVSKGDAGLCAAPGGFVPLDNVELKLRGSSRGSRSRSSSPSPTHRAQQQLQQHEPARSAASAAAAAVVEAAGLRSIAAVVSRAAAPAATATAAAWDALGASRRSSAGELRHPAAARRVSGSIAPAKLVPLQTGSGSSRSSSSSSGGGSEGCRLAALQAPEVDAEAASGAAPAEGGCGVSRTLMHSSDGTPCRLVRCDSRYLGRTSSSSSARQLQAQDGQQRGVHFQGWAEQVVFDSAAMQGRRAGSSGTSSSSSSIQSFTEEQLLEAQGGWEFVRPPDCSSSYTTLIDSQVVRAAAAPGGRGPGGAAAAGSDGGLSASTAASGPAGGSGELQEVPLVEAKPVTLLNKARGGGCEYQLRLHTADKVGAGLPAGQRVFVEVLGSTGALLTTQLPRPKGSFLRGCCDTFSLASAAGDIGRVEAVRVWHEPGGGSIGGSWCLQRLEVEAVFRGVTYAFAKSPAECWIGKGADRAVVLNKPRLLRSGDESALLAEAAELQQQLRANVSLEAADRAVLAARLQNLQLRLNA